MLAVLRCGCSKTAVLQWLQRRLCCAVRALSCVSRCGSVDLAYTKNAQAPV